MDEEDTMLLRNPKGEPEEVKSLITKNSESHPESELATLAPKLQICRTIGVTQILNLILISFLLLFLVRNIKLKGAQGKVHVSLKKKMC